MEERRSPPCHCARRIGFVPDGIASNRHPPEDDGDEAAAALDLIEEHVTDPKVDPTLEEEFVSDAGDL